MSPTDQELLAQYVQGQSDPTFTAVVERHVNLVYSAALRITAGDAALAEDITQKVFTDLARKAASVARVASVAGWLHTHTRFISLSTIRGEHRRRVREQEAFAMQEQPSTREINWSQLRPLLDEAVGELRPADRDAVILRYFENKSHREVGEALGLNENAARMKIERAVDKLQAHFVRHGLTVSSAIIAATMSANSVQAAPVGLGIKIASASLTAGGGAGGLIPIISHTLSMSTKTKIIITALIMVAFAAIPITSEYQQIRQMREQTTALVREKAGLQLELNRVKTRLNEMDQLTQNIAGKSSLPAVAAALASDAGSIEVKLSMQAVHGLSFQALDGKGFKLSKEAVALLGLTPEENTQMQNVMDELKNRVREHAVSVMQQIPADQAKDPAVSSFLADNPMGQASIYQIPAYSKEDGDALQAWFASTVNSVIGPERGSILAEKGQSAFKDWLAAGSGTTVAFVDNPGTLGQAASTSWLIKRQTSAGGNSLGTSVQRGDGQNAVPPEFSYLFEEVKDKASAP